jgi:flagellin
MGFRINTNIAAMNAQQQATMTNRMLDKSLGSLASGLRINAAADDSSGLVIADSLRSQANSLGQAVNNANDAIGVIQTADKAMDEQIKILDTIKTKSIQAASDTQSATSREAIQKDVNRLLEQLDNIAKTTSFNGNSLLNGAYTNKSYQVGAYADQTISASISDTRAISIGNVTSQNNIVEIGNTAATGDTSSKGSSELLITAGNLNGVAIGDKITIDGQKGTFTVLDFTDGAGTAADDLAAGAGLLLDRALDTDVAATDTVSVAEHAAFPAGQALTADIASGVTTFTLAGADLPAGIAVGDTLTLTDSSTGLTEDIVIDEITGAGVVTWTGATTNAYTAADTTFSFSARNDIGTAATGANLQDHVQYTVEGTLLTAVQLTDASGNGVANTGLGQVADTVNATSGATGITAVATVEMNSAIAVQAGTLGSDMTINGVTILTAGSALVSGDTDSVLVNAVNAKTAETGVTASIDPDGSLTLTSDGRAMNLANFSGATGLSDGIEAGSIEFFKNGVEPMTITAAHYQTAGLGTANGAAEDQELVAEIGNLADIQFGTNGIDSTVGLLRTREGANQSMRLAESAIGQLDAQRADLGAVQNQLVVTINNISVTQVNVKAAESQIRDVDFAQESSNFSRLNILAQSGSYALSQANAVQQNVLRLLQ